MKPILHFAHGNGFPALCYRQLLTQLTIHYDCCYIDKIGHHSSFPVTENWHFLVEEVIASIQRQTDEPVVALGHSLGGVLSLLAAIEYPALFKAVILLDSPLIGRFKSNILRLAKALGFIDRITPALRTRRRKTYWQNREQLVNYLKSKDLFKTFSDQCLEDYIDYGLKKTEEGYFLCFDRHIEYLIYRTIPHHLPQYEGKLMVPAALIYGEHSPILNKADRAYMEKYYNITSFKNKGTHMFPMEYPEETAEQIFKVVKTLLA